MRVVVGNGFLVLFFLFLSLEIWLKLVEVRHPGVTARGNHLNCDVGLDGFHNRLISLRRLANSRRHIDVLWFLAWLIIELLFSWLHRL